MYDRDPELDEILVQCAADLGKHMQVFHPMRFTRKFSEPHRQVFEALTDPSIQLLLVLAHRGWGKSSIFNFGLPSQAITFGLTDFIVPVSATATLAEMHSENLKRELTTNASTQAIVGDIKSESFSKEMWTTSNGITVLPRGSGQQIRGVLQNNSRPGLIIADDLETKEGVMSADQRDKLKRWFLTDVVNAVDRSRKDWKIVVIGTILHEDSLLQELREDPDWKVLEFPLCDSDCNPLWDNFMTKEQILALRESYRRKGILEEFYMEFMNIATPVEDAVFKTEFFRYYEEDGSLNALENVVIVDPAKTAKMHNAASAVIGVAADYSRQRYYVRDILNVHVHPDELYRLTFDMAERLGAKVIACEATGIEEFIKQPFQNMMMTAGKHFEFVWLKARSAPRDAVGGAGAGAGKTFRVRGLGSYYRQGQVYHNPACCGVLEEQLLAFPRSKRWDVMDGFAYVIELMDIGGRYFDAEVSDVAVSEEDEYRALAKEDEGAIEDEEWSESAEDLRFADSLEAFIGY